MNRTHTRYGQPQRASPLGQCLRAGIWARKVGFPSLYHWGKQEGLVRGTSAISPPCLGSHFRSGDHSTKKHQGLCSCECNLSGRPACKTHKSQSLFWFQNAGYGPRKPGDT